MCAKEAFLSLHKIEINLFAAAAAAKRSQEIRKGRKTAASRKNQEITREKKLFLCEASKKLNQNICIWKRIIYWIFTRLSCWHFLCALEVKLS